MNLIPLFVIKVFLLFIFISFLYIEEEHLTTLKSRRQFVRILSRHQDISHSKY